MWLLPISTSVGSTRQTCAVPVLRVAQHLVERLVALPARLPRETEHLLADGVALHLVGAAGDRVDAPVEERERGRRARALRLGCVPRDRVAARELHAPQRALVVEHAVGERRRTRRRRRRRRPASCASARRRCSTWYRKSRLCALATSWRASGSSVRPSARGGVDEVGGQRARAPPDPSASPRARAPRS